MEPLSLRSHRSSSSVMSNFVRRSLLSLSSVLRETVANVLPPADLVQDLYMKELKAYKVPPVKAGDADAHVQKFSPPQAPKSPEEADIANELKAYEAQTVEIEGQAEGGAVEQEVDWFEEEPEEETAHH
jgi:F-type H+-transporting ATPase subunit h